MFSCCCIFSWLVLAGLSVVAYRFFFVAKDPETRRRKKIFGKYNKDGQNSIVFYIKFLAFYLVMEFRKWRYLKSTSNSDPKTIVKIYSSIEEKDKLQPLSNHPKAIDAVFFNGASKDGYYFVAGFARRPRSVVDGFIFLRIPGVGLFQAPRLPDARIFADSDDVYSGEGFRIEPVEAMRRWKVTYEGKMRHTADPDKLVDVEVILDFESTLRHFDFNTDVSSIAMARSIAREEWSKDFFKMLQESHQNHYEQMGTLVGKACIEGFGEFPLRLQSMRDHSYCFKREWKSIHRYIIHYVTVEDGTRFMVGIISMPMSMSIFEAGYVYTPSGILIPVDSCDMPLWYLGENGNAPQDYGFTFTAGGKTYQVQVNIQEFPELFIGEEWEARILEGMCRFKVNDKDGWGFAEWDYHNEGGRDPNYPLSVSPYEEKL